jgi:hypothetical protein
MDGEPIGLAPNLAGTSSRHRGAAHQAAARQVLVWLPRPHHCAGLGRRTVPLAGTVECPEDRRCADGQSVDSGHGWSAPGQPRARAQPDKSAHVFDAVVEACGGAKSSACRGFVGHGHVLRRGKLLWPAGSGARVCGLRWGEATGLRVKDIDFKRRRLEVRLTIVEVDGFQIGSETLGYEARSIPTSASLLARLVPHVERKGASLPVFAAARGGSLRGRGYRRG